MVQIVTGPPEKVVAFLNECVFKKTYTKDVTIGADVRTQVSLRVDNSPGPSNRLIDLTENAPMNKSGKAKKLQVPIGIEAVNQYKKPLMALHEFQVITRDVTWPSPKVTKEVKNIIKQYGTNLVYDKFKQILIELPIA
ncbi:hypothetical protein [Parasitella parasitica]|uniref:Uncharacterized protein n=1 Tax=Parasitella parasitica TaxID=35722 RepID=A0A0B7N673_9FUNG|nr:hypothetical protein [Parasitella parasitica]